MRPVRAAAGWSALALLGLTACASDRSKSVPSATTIAAIMAAEQRPGPFRMAQVDLNDDGRNEVIIRFDRGDSCGSGGCSAFILTPEGAGQRMVLRATLTRLPFRKLETRTNGWADLGVTVGGGGMPRQEMRLRYDGVSYPANPTTLPAAPSNAGAGTVILDTSSKLILTGD